MNKKIVEEVVVSDRTCPMTNPGTNESLRVIGARGEDDLQSDNPVLWLF